MLEHVKQLEREGRWSEIRQLVPQLLPTFDGTATDAARLRLFLVTALVRSASDAADFRAALQHARLALATAPAGSMVEARAHQKLSSLNVDLGRPAVARRHALAYLSLAPRHPKLAVLTPWVVRDLAHIAYQSHQYRTAITRHRQALAMFREAGNIAETLRTQLSLVWACVRAGQVRNARGYLPESVPADMQHLLDGASAAICALEGRWAAAYDLGIRATRYATRFAYDYADAAEVCLILAQAARHLFDSTVSAAHVMTATDFASRQGWSLEALSQRARGGELLYVDSAAAFGKGGWYPDACYTTGVA